MTTKVHKYLRPIRSFVRREGRMTAAQRRALTQLWPRFGQDKVELITKAQKDSGMNLDVLLPSILDKALKGELVLAQCPQDRRSIIRLR